MMSTRRQNGAVNVVFLIIAVLFALVGWGLWYSAQKQGEENLKKAEQFKKLNAETEETFTRARQAYDALAEEVGLVPPLNDPGSSGSPDAWKQSVADRHKGIIEQKKKAREAFEAANSESFKLTDLFAPAETKISNLQNEVARLKRDIEGLTTGKKTAEDANVAVADTHSKALAEKNTELAQIRERGETLLKASEEKNDKTSKDLKDATDKLTEVVAKHQKELQDATDKVVKLEREVAVVKIPERIKRATEDPDGKILEVDYKIGMAWIDIGSKQFVRRGTRFKCYDVLKGGVREEHGYIVVLDLQPDKAKCSIEGGASVKQGDLITNPYFDKNATKRFFFLGSLPGRFDNQTAANKLRAMGAAVDEKMSVHIDFIVLGNDPNPEAVGENANPEWFKDKPEYNDALRWGIETIRARDLETFLME